MRARSTLLIVSALLLSVPLCPGQVTGGVIVGGSVEVSTGGSPGTPFSADVVDEITRVLADGNRIHEEHHGKFYRDSQGRSRDELEYVPPMAGAASSFQHVTIVDPTQHLLINLDPQRKTAMVVHVPRDPSAPRPAQINPPATSQSAAAAAQPQAQARPHARDWHLEPLGTMQIEGFTVNGTRQTMTIPAGAEGNEKPIVSVTEFWASPELHSNLLTRRVDPRVGQTLHRLVNIQVGEPDILLFQVPADYQVKDVNQNQHP